MTLFNAFKNSGAENEGNVSVDISYDIIRHVSAQLYTSPRKAIEELICNAYDAGASECHVALPATSSDPLLVLDNGKSMNLQGIHSLWQVARSPKVPSDAKDGEPRIANGRMQIGKFGVGKLAAFALGKRLTHVACVNNTVRIISVGQDEIKGKAGGTPPTFVVQKLPLSKAKTLLDEALKNLPKPWEKDWGTWTLAMVEDIGGAAIGSALKIGVLRRMIETALPVSSTFKVFLEKEQVPRRPISKDEIVKTVEVIDQKFRKHLTEALREYWAQKRSEPMDDLPSSYYALSVETVRDPENVQKTLKALIVPFLGPVIGNAVATKTSLVTEKLQERGYANNGFAITSYGKLVNPEDPLFGVTQRSHKYWSRFLARIEIPSLDKVLLVQRNAVSENAPEAEIAREVLRALFNYTRSQVEEDEDAPDYDPGSFGQRLGTLSPIMAQAALKGLLKGVVAPHDLKKLSIDFGTLGVDGPAAKFDPEAKSILINEDHPLLTSMDDLGALSKQMRRAIGEVLGGVELSKGYLRSRSVPEDIIVETGELLDASLRSAAEFVRDPVEEHIQAIKDASFIGDTPFEKAVVEAFRSLRLAARHYGASDEPDGIIEFPMSGKDNLRISVEAKGSKGVITHKELSEATVSRHSGEHACQRAIAIAREFATEGIGGKNSALLRETEGKVPLLTVDGIARMLRLHKRRNFTYDKVVTILTTWKHPDDLLAFIDETWRQMPEPGLMRLILTVAHDLITDDSTNLPDPGMIVADPRVRSKKIKKDDVINVLLSVELTTHMLTIVDPNDHRFELNAPVDTILDAMQADYEDVPTTKK
jgi:hypothetical protein